MSLASRIKAVHHAMTAEELADLLKVARLTILRRAKRGTIPSFRVGSCVRFDPAKISKMAGRYGCEENVKALNIAHEKVVHAVDSSRSNSRLKHILDVQKTARKLKGINRAFVHGLELVKVIS